MMNFRKTVWATMIAVPTLFTACSDPEVSDEVELLRQTQNELLAQRVEKQKLDNALQALENARTEAENAAAIAKANLEAQQAADELAAYLRSQGLQEAADLLGDYTSTLGKIAVTEMDITDKETQIADMKDLIGAENPNDDSQTISFELAAEIIQADLDERNAQLAAQQAALAILEGVAADPSSVQEEINTAMAMIQDLENKNLGILVDIVKAEQAFNAAIDAWESALNLIDTYENAVAQSAAVQIDIDAQIVKISNQEVAIVALEADIAQLDGVLATAQASVAAAEAALAPYLADIAAAEAVVFTTFAAAEAAQVTFNIVQNDFNNGNATMEEVNAAQAALDAAEADFDAAEDAYDAAVDAAEDPQETLDAAVSDRDDLQDFIAFQNQNLVTANNNLADFKAELVDLEEDLADYQQEIAALQAAYDVATGNGEGGLVALEDAVEAAEDAWEALWAEYSVNDDMIDNFEDVLDVLGDELDGINGTISVLKDDIEDTEADVVSLTKMLSDNTISLAEWQAEIEDLELELANLQAELTALEAKAAAELAAYNAALASQQV